MSPAKASMDVVAKGNDYAIEALKQLLTLSTVVLALTITFLKDVIGEARSQAQVAWLVPLAWACFLIAIWVAWVAIGHAARAMASGEVTGYAFVDRRRWLVRVPHWSFFAALFILAVFGSSNLKLIFSPSASKIPEEIKAHHFIAVDTAGKPVWKAP